MREHAQSFFSRLAARNTSAGRVVPGLCRRPRRALSSRLLTRSAALDVRLDASPRSPGERIVRGSARGEWLFFRAVFSVVVVVVWRRCAWREVFVVDGVCSWCWCWWRVWQLIDRWSLAFALSLSLSLVRVCD